MTGRALTGTIPSGGSVFSTIISLNHLLFFLIQDFFAQYIETQSFIFCLTKSGSPRRLPHQVHGASGPASTSGRMFEDVSSANRHMEERDDFTFICHHSENGIFYQENGHYYPVKHGISLVEFRGYIIGRASNGLIVPIFNSKHDRVMAEKNNYQMQCLVIIEKPRDEYAFRPIPSHFRVVNLPVPEEPEVNVLPNEPKVNVQSSASPQKFGEKQ